MQRAGRHVAVVVALATGVLGCSGSDSSLSIAEFRTRAVAICRAAARATPPADATAASGAEAVADDLARARRRLRVERRALQRLRALAPPDARREEVRAWLAAASDAIRAEEQAVAAVADHDVAGADAASARARGLTRRADDAATRLGVAACVSPALPDAPAS
jgi:hypothetical protein